jgi:hypothetical protein
MLTWAVDRCRELYNAALQERREAYRLVGKSVTYYDQASQLPAIKDIRDPKPKQAEDGMYLPSGAAVKGGLNKSITDAGWGNSNSSVSTRLQGPVERRYL